MRRSPRRGSVDDRSPSLFDVPRLALDRPIVRVSYKPFSSLAEDLGFEALSPPAKLSARFVAS